jgi:hypothetical protein
MDAVQFQALHDRIRRAQLPGYSLHYADGPDTYWMEISGHNGERLISREHSFDVLMQWADGALNRIGA